MMNGGVGLVDHHALCPSYRDIVFNPPARSHLVWVDALCGNRCKGKQWALPRCRVRYLDSLSLSDLLSRLCLGGSYRSSVASAIGVGESEKP